MESATLSTRQRKTNRYAQTTTSAQTTTRAGMPDGPACCNDRCPTCHAVVEPYAMTRNADQSEVIHNREVYNKANVVGE